MARSQKAGLNLRSLDAFFAATVRVTGDAGHPQRSALREFGYSSLESVARPVNLSPTGAAKIRRSWPGFLDPSRAGEEVAGPAPSRDEQGGASGLLRGLRPVRRRLPHGGGETPEGRSQPGLPLRELPTGAAVRGRVGAAARFRSEEVVGEIAWTEAEGRGVSRETIPQPIHEISVACSYPKMASETS